MNMQDVVAHIVALERMGCAVAVFTPEEMGEVNPKRVADRMIEAGWEAIDVLANEVEEDEE